MHAARPILALAFLVNVLLGTTLHQSTCVHWSVTNSPGFLRPAGDRQADSTSPSSHHVQKCDDPRCLFHRHHDEKTTPVPVSEPVQESNGPTHHRAKCSVCQTLLLTALPAELLTIEQLARAEQLRILDHLRFYRPDAVYGFSVRGPPLA